MTFNIRQGRALDGQNRWYKRRELVFEVTEQYRPHVLSAQEVHPMQLDELLDELSGYVAIALRRYGGLIGAFAPILFDPQRLEPVQSGDFWLAPDPDGPKRRAWDAAVPRICTWAVFRDRCSAGRFIVFNSHFDQRGPQAKLNSARLVAQRLLASAHIPRMFMADLNANEQSEVLKILLDAGLHDTFRVVHPDAAPSFTYHRFRGRRSKGMLGKIDHVLVDDRWDVLGAEIVRTSFDGRFPSDHFPVTADVVLKG